LPGLCARIRGVGTGGILSHPVGPILDEVAFIAYHFHWSQEEIMRMEHPDRRRWVEAISALNTAMNGDE
jgi:hypothetical protein